MFDFNYEENFEPSSNTKQWCLYTHKTPRAFAGVNLPGLFQTTNYVWQILGFIAIFLLEGLATFWCFLEGVVITAILASIFVDLVLAIVAHLYQKDICRMQNELIYEEQENAGRIERQLKSFKLRQNFFYLLIMISAIFKIFWFFDVYRIVDATMLFIMTCYIIGAILHITCTGYALFTFIFNWKINREHNAYLDSNHTVYAFDKNSPLRTRLNSQDVHEAQVGRHQIIKDPDGHIYLETLGVLTDAELWTLIGKQVEQEHKRALAVDGVRHQILILEQDPMGVHSSKSTSTDEKHKMGVVA